MDQPSPPGVGRQPIDGCGSRHRKEVSEGHNAGVRAKGSGGHIDVEFNVFEGTLGEGGKLQQVREEGGRMLL